MLADLHNSILASLPLSFTFLAPAGAAQTEASPEPVYSNHGGAPVLSVRALEEKPATVPFSTLDRLSLDGLVPLVSLDAPDMQRIQAEDLLAAQNTEKVLRYGISRDVTVGFDDGLLVSLSDGSYLWTVELVSKDALGMRLHFTGFNLPRGSEVVVYPPDAPEQLTGPYDGLGLVGDGEFWTPTRPGERLRVEYRLSGIKPGDDLSACGFVIDRLIHVYRSPVGGGVGAGGQGSFLGAGNCHNDVTCFSQGSDTKKAVAGIGFINSNALFCTGSLLNSQSGDFDPYWMTANHCLSSNSEAQSSEIYWRYETSSCNGSPPSLASVPQSAVCTLLATGSASDFTLLRVDGAMPTASLYWAPWSTATPSNGSSGNCVHHPSGDYKRISFGTYSSTTSCGGGSHFRVNWTNGPTEPGSSGSPFYVDGLGFVGQLHCGPSGCGNETNDQYGSFSSSWSSVSSYLTNGEGDDQFEPNDSCSAAATLTDGTYGNLKVKASDEDWYALTVASGDTLTVSAQFTDAFGDIDLQLFDACGGTEVQAAETGTNNENLSYTNSGAGATFYLRVFLWDNDALNEYGMTVSGAGGGGGGGNNDSCSNALAISDGVHSGTLVGATNDGNASCGSSNSSSDVWFSWTASCTGTASISTCGTNDIGGTDQGIDTVLSVYSSCGGSELACNDDDALAACSGFEAGLARDSAVQVPVAAGQTLLVRVSTWNNSATGPFTLRVSCAGSGPSNDSCTNPTVVSDGTHNGTLVGATADGSASCGQSTGSPDVWYSYTATCTGTLTVSTCGTHDTGGTDQGIDTVLSLHNGCLGNGFACNDDDNSVLACGGIDQGVLRDSAVQTSVTVGDQLLIRVSNFNNTATGPFVLNIACAGSPGGPTPYCDPANANSVSATGAKLSSLGGYGSTFAAFEIIDLPNQPGILYAGPNQIQIPFGCGERCVGGGLIRFGVVFATSNVATTVVDMTSGPGLDNVQFWYRDPDQTSLCGSSFNLSNALAD